MKLRYALVLLSFLSFQSYSHAQTTTPQELVDHGREVGEDTEHDLPENDPSDPTKVITLDKENTQKNYAIMGTIKKLAENAEQGLLNAFNPNYYESWIMNHLYPKLSYAEIVQQKPEMFNYFKINEHRFVPQKKYGPTNVNSNAEYKGISDRKFGYCWGYATYVRFFTQVAFYDPSLPRADLKTIYSKIDLVLKGQAQVFEGFANLRELTLIPEVEFYLKLAAMELWRARAVKFSSVGITLKSTKWLDFNDVENLLTDLEVRLARGEFPKIIMASEIPADPYMGMNTDIHVIPVYSVERLPDHKARIHLWDINFYTETLIREPKFLDIDTNHGIHYAPYYEAHKPYAAGSDIIGRIVIAPENDSENVTMLYSLRDFCKDSKTAKYCKNSD
jgi:hypothetical protein